MAASEGGFEKDKLKIVFMGTPEFAVASLDALVRKEFNVVAVITAPDKQAGRGMKVNTSPVKRYAIEQDIKVLQPPKLKDPEFLQELRSLHADLQVVVAFRMLPESVWNMPPMGTINVHASLLPKYRGAAPINWAIINGEKETGVTTFKLMHEIDTGNILLKESLKIDSDETAGELHDRLKEMGAVLLIKTIEGLINGSIREQPQELLMNKDEKQLHAPKIFTETCKIDWSRNVEDIYNLIRGLSPHPGAFTELNGKMFKILRSRKETASGLPSPGSVETDHKEFLRFVCGDGYIYATEVQAEGKKRMGIAEFLRGNRVF